MALNKGQRKQIEKRLSIIARHARNCGGVMSPLYGENSLNDEYADYAHMRDLLDGVIAQQEERS